MKRTHNLRCSSWTCLWLLTATFGVSCNGDDSGTTEDETEEEASGNTTKPGGGKKPTAETGDAGAPDAPTTKDPSEEPEKPKPSTNPTAGDRTRLAGVRTACEELCDAQFATDCVNPAITIEICDLQCVASISHAGEFCVKEYEARTQCLADGGFECLQGNVVPRSTCAGESLAFSECARDLPCKQHCRELLTEGCVDDEAECFDQCLARRTELQDLSCQGRYDQLIACDAQQGITCTDGKPVSNPVCHRALFEYQFCLHEDDLCEAWCAVSGELGCKDADCLTRCKSELADPVCGRDYQQLLECGERYGDLKCEGDRLTASHQICDSEAQRLDECVAAKVAP